MLLNELAQWAVLIFLAIFVIGLTRQLGRFMVGEREEIAHSVGPDVGKALPREVLPEIERRRLAELIGSSPAGWGALLVVDADCIGCAALLERMEHEGAPDGAPVAALSRSSDPEHVQRLARIFDIAVADPERVTRAGLRVTPFVILLDRDLRIAYKALTSDIRAALAQWRSTNGLAPSAGAEPGPVVVSHARGE
jgi:hypothetical protein